MRSPPDVRCLYENQAAEQTAAPIATNSGASSNGTEMPLFFFYRVLVVHGSTCAGTPHTVAFSKTWAALIVSNLVAETSFRLLAEAQESLVVVLTFNIKDRWSAHINQRSPYTLPRGYRQLNGDESSSQGRPTQSARVGRSAATRQQHRRGARGRGLQNGVSSGQ